MPGTSSTTTTAISKILVAMPESENIRAGLADAFDDLEIVLATGDDVLSEIRDADGVICWRLPEGALAAAERLQWVHVGAAGVEQILGLPGFREKGLTLTNSSGISAPNMAEHTIAMMLAFARKLPWLQRSQEHHRWRDWEAGHDTFEIGGQTVVLVGLGAIGTETARRAKALGMRVIGVRRTVGAELPEFVDEVIATADLDVALAQADHVVNSLPSTAETRGLFNAERFAATKTGAHFYNLGRGTTVVEADLIAALASGQIAGAGLDVTDPEPLPEDSPLWDIPEVMITAHTSGNSPMVRTRLIALAIEQVRRFVAGEELLNVVNQDLGY